MAIGKNKKLSKKGKGLKKKVIDPLSRKEWFDLKAPVPFQSGSFGKTLVNKSSGQKIATEQIKGRVVETSLADLQGQSDQLAWRKVKLVIDDVEGRNCKTSFYGLDITRDKLCQMIRKWQNLIEVNVDTKTVDGYILRVFVICFTRKIQGQKRTTTYAKKSQIKSIRKRITDIIVKEVSKRNINEFLHYFNTDLVSKEIIKKTKFVFPVSNITVRKVKMIKRPKIDATKLSEMYDQSKRNEKKDNTKRIGNAEDVEAVNLLKQE